MKHNDDVVCVAALDKGTGYIDTVASCSVEDAPRYAQYFRRIGYGAKIITYEELAVMQAVEASERRARYG